jgi:hypothetical protein
MGTGASKSGPMSSMGIGKTMVEFWFDPLSSSVCMQRRAKAAGWVEMISVLLPRVRFRNHDYEHVAPPLSHSHRRRNSWEP